uniref:Uncharacterized protein n=1 Tax=viral metagenome TaxID=1070528 RepID=A0A6C0IRP4_9ZZZZ
MNIKQTMCYDNDIIEKKLMKETYEKFLIDFINQKNDILLIQKTSEIELSYKLNLLNDIIKKIQSRLDNIQKE